MASHSELSAVDVWRKESLANEEAYRELCWLSKLADEALSATESPPPDPALLIVEAERRLTQADVRPAGFRRGMVHFAKVAAAVLVVVTGGILARSFVSSDTPVAQRVEYRTAPEERRTIRLEDGTLVHLGPSTTLQVQGDATAPQLWLEGRAFFGVPKKEGRRIVIETTAGRVTVLGTRFDLQSRGDNLQLMVVDGEVSIAAGAKTAGVASGELGLVNGGDLESVVRIQDPFAYLAWMESAMVFQATPFGRAAEEIASRYDVEFDIRDEAVRERTVTTSFQTQDLEEVLTIMCGVVSASCELEGGAVTVTSF